MNKLKAHMKKTHKTNKRREERGIWILTIREMKKVWRLKMEGRKGLRMLNES